MILSVSAVSLLWNFIYFPTDKGILNTILIHLGLENLTQQWLVNPDTALIALIAVSTWTSVRLLYDYLSGGTDRSARIHYRGRGDRRSDRT